MEETTFFGSLFEPIEKILAFILGGLYKLTESFGFGSYGLAIIILTVLIKFCIRSRQNN